MPIPGTRTLGHLAENLAAASIAVPDEVAAAIEKQFGPGAAVGAPFHKSFSS